MALITFFGLLAGTFTTISFLPQVVKSWKLKETKDISFPMLFTLLLGICFWLIYGIMIGDFPLMISNSVTLLIISIVMGLKIKYK